MSLYESRLSRDSDALRRDIASLASDVHTSLKNAVRALLRQDRELAYQTILGDHPINRKSEEVEASAHRFLAKHLPSGKHLRLVSSAMRMAILLERMGDYATTICRETVRLQVPLSGTFRDEVEAMAADSLQMFEQAVKAFEQGDESLARGTMGFAKQVDRDFAIAYSLLLQRGDEEVAPEELFGRHAVISRLERVSDQAKNLCEETVFALSGETKKRRPFRLLYVDESDDGLTQLAAAITEKQCAGRAMARSAGRLPAPSLDVAMAEFMVEHGYDTGDAAPRSVDVLDMALSDFDVVIALGVDVDALVSDLPFHTVALRWDVDGSDLESAYRELASRISDLVEIVRGPGGHEAHG